MTRPRIAAVVLLCATLAGGCASSAPRPEPTASPSWSPGPEPVTPAFPWTQIPEGTWRVGQQIVPGRYTSQTNVAGCTWARLSGGSGSARDVIDEGSPVAGETATVDVGAADVWFRTRGCSIWVRVG